MYHSQPKRRVDCEQILATRAQETRNNGECQTIGGAGEQDFCSESKFEEDAEKVV